MTKPVEPGQRWHCMEIPHGYVPVEVEQVVDQWNDLELDIVGGDGETKLGECSHGIILWSKRDIAIPGSTKSPSDPPSPRGPPDHDSLGAHDANPSPSPSPPRRKSPSPPRQKPEPKKRSKLASLAPPPQKKPRKVKEKPAPPKKAYDLTQEELDASVKEDVKRQLFTRKQPEPKIDPATAKSFLQNLTRGQKKRAQVSDYDRSLLKSQGKRKAAASKPVAQLGNQPQESLPQLASEYELNVQRQMAETGLSREEITGEKEIPVSTDIKWPFKLGQPLVGPEMESTLQTKMRRFHQWYLEQSRSKRRMFGVRVKDHDFFNGEETIWLEFKDIYEVYHKDAMDVSLVACWVL